MNKHWDDASLLEAHYLETTRDGELAGHLATCNDCRLRLMAVVAIARQDGLADELPETFWTRQRMLVARRIAAADPRSRPMLRMMHVAVAAMLALVLGGFLFYRSTTSLSQEPLTITQAAATRTAPVATEELNVPHDPWESEQLKDFSSVVEWESLVDKSPTRGDQS